MVDWAGDVESKNQCLARRTDRRHLLDLLAQVTAAAAVFGVLFFYSWIHSRMESIGYEQNRLQAMEHRLLEEQNHLIAQEGFLTNPERLDQIARTELMMQPARASQMLPGVAPVEAAPLESRLAMAVSLPAPPGAGKP